MTCLYADGDNQQRENLMMQDREGTAKPMSNQEGPPHLNVIGSIYRFKKIKCAAIMYEIYS